MTCPVCRAIPRGLRDWLLEVFASGNQSHYLYPTAESYVRWGAKNIIRGNVGFPIKSGAPGCADPFDALRVALDITDDQGLEWSVYSGDFPVTFSPKGPSVRFIGEWRSPKDPPELTKASQIARLTAARLNCDERTAVRLLEEAVATATGFGGLIAAGIALAHRPYEVEGKN